MKRDLLRLFCIFIGIVGMMVAFAGIQSQVGYETFATGGIVFLIALAFISVLVTIITIRKERK